MVSFGLWVVESSKYIALVVDCYFDSFFVVEIDGLADKKGE